MRRRRPQVEYYYDDEEYDDDYREERVTRRYKPLRSRTRRPDYDDYTSQDRRYKDVSEQRPLNSDRTRDEYDYEDSSIPKTRPRQSESRRFSNERNDRRRNQGDKRFSSERRNINIRNGNNRMRPRPNYEDSPLEVQKPSGRPMRYDNDEEYEDDKYPIYEQDNDAPKVRPSGSGSSIYTRPRAPPKINRPVPITDRKKYEYVASRPADSKLPLDDEYEDYDRLSEPIPAKLEQKKSKEHGPVFKKEVSAYNLNEGANKSYESEEGGTFEEDKVTDQIRKPAIRNQSSGNRQTAYTNLRNTLQKDPVSSRKHQPATFIESSNEHTNFKKDIKPSQNTHSTDQDLRVKYNRPSTNIDPPNSGQRFNAAYDQDFDDAILPNEKIKVNKQITESVEEPRPFVRVVKRPFLPSRGGSPYLPRGLKPVGIKGEENQNTALDSELIEYNSSNESKINNVNLEKNHQIESPKKALDKIYNSELDITLNDALNPALKPLTFSRSSPVGFATSTKYATNPLQNKQYASSDILNSASQRHDLFTQQPSIVLQKSAAEEFYDDYDY